MSASRTRIAFLVLSTLGIAAAACGSLADLEVAYDSVGVSVDGGGIDSSATDGAGGGVRVIVDSSFAAPETAPPLLDPSDAGPCAADSDDGGGCDFSQGLGCCLAGGGDSRCIFQWEIAEKCAGGLFVGCRADDPTSESACCWRTGPSGSRMSVFAASCDGGAHACIPDAGNVDGTDGTTCNAAACPLAVGTFTVGSTGNAEVCP